MIYTNFLLFIAAVIIFASAPLAPGSRGAFPPGFHLYGIGLILLVFWQFNRYKFMKLKAALESDKITIGEAKKKYQSIINIYMIFALFAFAAEIFLFDLKYFLTRIPVFGVLRTPVEIAGIAFFILHLCIVWYWAFRAMGDVIFIGKSARDHIKANIKFNLVIVLPWLLVSFIFDIFALLSASSLNLNSLISSPLAQMIFFVFFIVVFTTFAPILITWLWDCKPLEDTEIKNTINTFCRAQGAKFKKIMSWNALNGSLVTAAVLGLIAPFRYLLITPELIKLLDKDELLGVVSHEVGHVKKNHLRYYLLFILAFMFISAIILQFANYLLYNTAFGWSILTQDNNIFGFEMMTNFLPLFIFLSLFILYFRFIFGYFMRNFERQADSFCFHSGVNPNLLVSSFRKLDDHIGGGEKKSNWHHYTIAQRIGFLEKCMDNPGHIAAHEKKVKRSLKVFIGAIAVLIVFSSYLFVTIPSTPLEALERLTKKDPNNPNLHQLLGDAYYSLEKWEKSKQAYESSIQLKYRQAHVLNNLAWLLLKCPDEKLLDPKRALKLAEDAVALDENSFYFLDTLAEAYFQNSRYKEAFYAAQKAYLLATENRNYYEEQLKKMAKYYKKFKSAITI